MNTRMEKVYDKNGKLYEEDHFMTQEEQKKLLQSNLLPGWLHMGSNINLIHKLERGIKTTDTLDKIIVYNQNHLVKIRTTMLLQEPDQSYTRVGMFLGASPTEDRLIDANLADIDLLPTRVEELLKFEKRLGFDAHYAPIRFGRYQQATKDAKKMPRESGIEIAYRTPIWTADDLRRVVSYTRT